MEEEINNTRGQADAQAAQTSDSTAASAPVSQQESAHEMAQLAKEYPEIMQGGTAVLPQEVVELTAGGMKPLDAYRLYDLRRVRGQYATLKAKYDAEIESKSNAAAALGSVAGGQAREKDYYTSQEWDKLPGHLKDKFIKNGKIFEFMKKWSV